MLFKIFVCLVLFLKLLMFLSFQWKEFSSLKKKDTIILLVKTELTLELFYFQCFTRHNLFLISRDFYYVGANF